MTISIKHRTVTGRPISADDYNNGEHVLTGEPNKILATDGAGHLIAVSKEDLGSIPSSPPDLTNYYTKAQVDALINPPVLSDILIVAGQSNAGGRGTGTLAGYTPNSNIKIWNGSTFVTYTPGTASNLTTGGTFGGSWGAEAEYARQYAALYPTKKLYIVKAHQDNTDLYAQWDPAGTANNYDAATSIITAAKAAVVATGETPSMRRVFWMQGENDAGDATKAAAYQTKLTSLISAMRSDWGITATTPITLGRIPRNYPYPAVATAQKTVADADPYVDLINTDDAPRDAGDDVHYGPFGLVIIGSRLWGADRGTYTFAEVAPYVINGSFPNDISFWQGADASWDAATQSLALANVGSAAIQGFVGGLTVGQTYDLTLQATSTGTVNQGIVSITKAGGVSLTNSYLTASPLTLTFTAESTVHGIYFLRNATAGVLKFDNFTVAPHVLATLALSSNTFTVGTASSGTITGATAGSTIVATNAPTGFTINSAARTWAYDGTGSATTGSVTLTETLAGTSNSPKATVIGYTVTGAAVLTATDANGTVTVPSAGVYRATKVSGQGSFNCGFHGTPQTGDFRYSIVLSSQQYYFIGLNPNASADSGSAIPIALYFDSGNISASDNNVAGASYGGFAAGDILWIDRTGSSVTFKKGAAYAGATTLRTVTLTGTQALDMSMYTAGTVLDVQKLV